MNARNLIFHLAQRIHCGAGLGRGKGGYPWLNRAQGRFSCGIPNSMGKKVLRLSMVCHAPRRQ
jgi:hypothetical protein